MLNLNLPEPTDFPAHVNKAHADFCNIKLSTEDWDT
jgi:hypothetical protein